MLETVLIAANNADALELHKEYPGLLDRARVCFSPYWEQLQGRRIGRLFISPAVDIRVDRAFDVACASLVMCSAIGGDKYPIFLTNNKIMRDLLSSDKD